MLYRLDTEAGAPVRDWHGDYLARHLESALRRARQEMGARGERIVVTRITGCGAMSRVGLVDLSGTLHRPGSTSVCW